MKTASTSGMIGLVGASTSLARYDSLLVCAWQTTVQDLDYENELELLYVVVSVCEGEQTRVQLYFLDDETGEVLKEVPIPTWKQVSN